MYVIFIRLVFLIEATLFSVKYKDLVMYLNLLLLVYFIAGTFLIVCLLQFEQQLGISLAFVVNAIEILYAYRHRIVVENAYS